MLRFARVVPLFLPLAGALTVTAFDLSMNTGCPVACNRHDLTSPGVVMLLFYGHLHLA